MSSLPELRPRQHRKQLIAGTAHFQNRGFPIGSAVLEPLPSTIARPDTLLTTALPRLRPGTIAAVRTTNSTTGPDQHQQATAPEMAPPSQPEYSTNRNTMKARKRKQALTGAAKVEEAARTSDYKAMIYARNRVQAKDEFKNASDLVKDQMLQEAMNRVMETRARKGQDTKSKMEKYYRGEYDYRHEKAGPDSRASVSEFLTVNQMAPPPLNHGPTRTIGTRSRAATIAAVHAEDEEHEQGDGGVQADELSNPVVQQSAQNHAPPATRIIKLSQPPEDRLLLPPPPPRALGSMAAPTLAQASQVARLQTEVDAMRSNIQSLVSGLGNARHDVTNLNATLTTVRTDASLLRAEMSVNKAQTDQVVSQMPQLINQVAGVDAGLHSLSTNRMPGVEERLARIEAAVDDMRRRMDDVLGYETAGAADARRARVRLESKRRELEELEREGEVTRMREQLRSVGQVLDRSW